MHCVYEMKIYRKEKKPTLMFVMIEINVMLFTLNDCRSILPQLEIFIWNFMLKIRKLSFVYLIIASLERDCSKMVQNNPIIEKCFAKDVKKLCKLKDEYALNIFRHKS